jgi:hypothetical protein
MKLKPSRRSPRSLVTVAAFAVAALGASAPQIALTRPTGVADSVRLRKLERRSVFAARDGESLGRIQDLMAQDGRVYLLDSRQMRIAWFDSMGVRRGAFGRPGNEAGEMRYPAALMAGRAGELLVVDAALRRVVRYQTTADSARPLAGFDVQLSPSDGCALSDVIVLSGYKDGSLLHLFALSDGTKVRSFGSPLRQGGALLQSTLDGAHLVCSRRIQTIVFASQLLGTIRAFGLDGSVRWTRTLPGFREASVRELPTGGVVHESPPDGYDHIVEMFSISDTLVILQTVPLSQERPSADRASSIRTVLLSARTGEVLGEQQDLPRLLGADARQIYERVPPPQPSVISHSFAVMRQP